MTEIFKLFPLCVYKTQLEDEESNLILNYASEAISPYINSDINGDSQYQINPDFFLTRHLCIFFNQKFNHSFHKLPRQDSNLEPSSYRKSLHY